MPYTRFDYNSWKGVDPNKAKRYPSKYWCKYHGSVEKFD